MMMKSQVRVDSFTIKESGQSQSGRCSSEFRNFRQSVFEHFRIIALL